MSPKRGEQAAPSPTGDEYDLRFANTEGADGWEHLSRQAPSNLRRAFERIRATPRAADIPDRQHRLRGRHPKASLYSSGQIITKHIMEK